MPFDVIVHAPSLKPGVRLNVAAADQEVDAPPARLAAGSDLRVRFGVCCPDVAKGTVIARDTHPDSVVISIDGTIWTLVGGISGVADAGLLSEDWFVAGAGALTGAVLLDLIAPSSGSTDVGVFR